MKLEEILVNCPNCKKRFDYYQSEFRPFCSKRCQMVDLGHWFQGSYSVAGEKVEQSDVENENDKKNNEEE